MALLPAQLILETGEKFSGRIPAHQVDTCFGEVVFNTGMVGYVESLTDPSYAGQILVFTYPLIGNYGVASKEHWESDKIHVKGVVISEIAAFNSHHSSELSLADWLDTYHVPYITGVDTRALTARLRNLGVIAGAITTHQTIEKFEDFSKINWVDTVTIPTTTKIGENEKTVVVVDCGTKENIIRCLSSFPITIRRVPYNYDYTEEAFDGIFISNGPGDPKHCVETIKILRKAMTFKKPIFGICLGTQLMALAAGANTYKLPFGHRSHNQPCIDLKTKACYLTSQNHSYAVDEKTLPNDWQITFRNLNDQSVEGIEHKQYPFFSVQFHPEASPGPLDTQWLFKKFYDLL